MKGLLLLFLLVETTMADNSLCADRPHNSFVSDPRDCRKYFLCQNEQAISAMCPQSPSESWFDFNGQACKTPGNYCTPSPCKNITNVFVEDTTLGCGSWHFCLDGEISHSDKCPHELSFIQDTQLCTYPFCNALVTI